ncbi:MAG: hypothetical protein HQL20_08585 [Candidatus Omnitrophica bacterium]|nr:hypothetical protein [Candidatus Omnitrophota bacterium]
MKMIIGCSVILALVAAGFLLKDRQKPYLVRINNYAITAEGFERDFKNSAFAAVDTQEARKDFLSSLVRRKLILQDAHAKGLDKDQEFLLMVERFWEQSLLQRAIDQKDREIASSVMVSDAAIEAEYKKLSTAGKANKTYDQMYAQIKWSLNRAEENKAMEQWVTRIYNEANIEVNSAYPIANDIKKNKNAG